tara:strand:- start:24499 stop:25050 length:552 start_codon:yes stop_codon:yes gene_type:complete
MPIRKHHNYYTYIPPEDRDGNKYWVPIVVKSKDVLFGFSEGVNIGLEIGESSVLYSPSMVLSSERFTDYTTNGQRLHEMDDDELRKYVTDLLLIGIAKNSSEHKDNGCIDIYDYSFHVSCYCGNFFGWENAEMLPDEDLHCEICDRKVIEYIGISDYDMTYDGIDQEKFKDIVIEIKKELGLE